MEGGKRGKAAPGRVPGAAGAPGSPDGFRTRDPAKEMREKIRPCASAVLLRLGKERRGRHSASGLAGAGRGLCGGPAIAQIRLWVPTSLPQAHGAAPQLV